MTATLQGKRVLVLEDDYYMASDLRTALEKAGAEVIGPFPDEAEASRAAEAARPDCALLDVNLGLGPSFDLPRALAQSGIPFAFVTGYDRRTIPKEFSEIEHLEKPIDADRAVAVAARLLRL